MIAYLDASILLRIVLRQRNALPQWPAIERGVASALIEVECLRVLDRLRLSATLNDEAVAHARELVYRFTEGVEFVEPTLPVLRRAAQPLPVPLRTLDAIHLATATLWRELRNEDLVMATHDRSLALAARASGLRVIGV